MNHKRFVLDVKNECCFQYGFGSRMIPCCLNVITCEEHDRMVQGPPLLGGAIGKHHYCPENAGEAHQILSSCKFSIVYDLDKTIVISKK